MAEAVQPVQQGERLATATPPMATLPRRRGRRHLVWLVGAVLGGLAPTVAGQRWDLQAVWQRLGMQAVDEPAVLAPPPHATDVAILPEHQRQQLTVEPVREQPLTVERETTGKVSSLNL